MTDNDGRLICPDDRMALDMHPGGRWYCYGCGNVWLDDELPSAEPPISIE